MKFPNKNKFKLLIYPFLILLGLTLGMNISNIKKFAINAIPVKVASSEQITSKRLMQKLSSKDFTFINVHTPYDGEIEKTDLFIEHDLIKTNIDSLPEDRTSPIILYCRSGNMSAQALQTLKGMGYTNVTHLKGGMKAWEKEGFDLLDLSSLSESVIPASGIELPVSWGDLGPQLTNIGVIDSDKFQQTMDLTDVQKQILLQGSDSKITINSQNSRFIVNMLWAAGLAQKSLVYQKGPLGTEYADKVGNFASTGGWSLAETDAVNYLDKHDLVELSDSQQEKVYEIASNVYRPCCGNSTAFPDCNHGMAALFAIELMVSQNISDDEIYKNLLALNSYWFPTTYLTAATYYARQGIQWNQVDAKQVLGEEFSSGSGAAELAKRVGPLPFVDEASGSCGA